jgi:long-chain acyl-CoA synthetase
MLLSDLIVRSAELFPDKPALVFPNEQITFGELHKQSEKVAAFLRKLGIRAGARVAILHENAIAPLVYFWGIQKVGAQVVDVPSLAGAPTIAAILRESKSAALVTSERQLGRVLHSDPDCLPPMLLTGAGLSSAIAGESCYSLNDILARDAESVPAPEVHEFEVALIIYTSGTTGAPKGVMLSHRNLLSNISATSSLAGLTSDDSILVVVPMHFIHGRMQLLTHALLGGTMVFSAGFQFPQQVADELARNHVTGFSGVPFHFLSLLEHTALASTRLPNLRYVAITGGTLPAPAIRKLSRALPGVAIYIAYGQTEASPRIAVLDSSKLTSKPGSCGEALPGVRIDILDEEGNSVPCGSVGEVVVSGPNVMCGYVSGDEITSGRIDRFGRLHTGDLGRLDTEGFLFLAGRKSELIKSAGERIFPREIESVLDSHPDVVESAVVGIPDDMLGERVIACVVVRADSKLKRAEELRTYCLKVLPLVRVPREIRLSEALPKTGSGKIERGSLVAHFHALGLNKPAQHGDTSSVMRSQTRPRLY